MKNVSKKLCQFKMKTLRLGSYSQSAIFVGGILLFMFLGNCIASPLGSIGYVNHAPSLPDLKSWVFSSVVQLSKTVGETQVNFAQIRLGDRDYDGYVHRIAGLPRPIWNQDKIQEQTLLKMEVEQLYIFKDFINEIKTREFQTEGSAFSGNFQEIENELNIVIGNILQMEIYQGYPMTNPATSPQPTRKPTTTQKEQDEWDLGVMKKLLFWLIPVQGELYQQLMNA